MKTLPGRITISRFMNTDDMPIQVEVIDGKSGCIAFRFRMSFETLARILTGQGEVSGTLEVFDAPIGKRHEAKEELLPCDFPYGKKNLLALAKKAMQKFEVDGWRGDESDLENHHNYVPGGIRVRFVRYVDEPTTEPPHCTICDRPHRDEECLG